MKPKRTYKTEIIITSRIKGKPVFDTPISSPDSEWEIRFEEKFGEFFMLETAQRKSFGELDIKRFIRSLLSSQKKRIVEDIHKWVYESMADEFNGDYSPEEKENPLIAYNNALIKVQDHLKTLTGGKV